MIHLSRHIREFHTNRADLLQFRGIEVVGTDEFCRVPMDSLDG